MTNLMKLKRTMVACSFVAVGALTGCGGSNKALLMENANSSIKDARSAVREAEQRGAREHAPLELRSAEQKLGQARSALEAGQLEVADRLAVQAEVDAELAEIAALANKAENAVKEIRESIKTMRSEIERYSGNRNK